MSRVLKLESRPPEFGSVADATPDDEASAIVDAGWEYAEWRAIAPPAPHEPASIVFIDGVQQYDARFSADGDGWPIAGVLASYAAGAMCPGDAEPLRHVTVERAAILGKGARPDVIAVRSSNAALTYVPASTHSDDPSGLESQLNALRGELEATIVRRLIGERARLVMVDGRLPPHTLGGAVGLIKTPRLMPIAGESQVRIVTALRTGERSPVFVRQRSDRRYYSWFICLRTPGARELSLSGVALMEMDGSAARDDVLRTADLTAALLPRYAPARYRDPRSPQNLLPVGQLERALRHRMGDRTFITRLLQGAFAREDFGWSF